MGEMAPGTVFAGHRIEGVAGRGGMGVVYRARQLSLERTVALKVIAPALMEDPAMRRRFVRESRVAAAIDHPHVIPVYYTGEEGGVAFIAMRFVAGDDVRTLVRREGPLDPERGVRIVDQVAAALDAAHAAGLVHRDVKPANVLLGQGDHVYLTDFGLTKHVLSEAGATHEGHWVGTLDFVSPEQIRGERVDARSDVYALGCLLHYTLTGRAPFTREGDEAKLWAHLSEPPPKLTDSAPGAPPALDAVVQRALAKDPADRYQSAGDLGRAATAAVTGEPSEPRERVVAVGAAAPVEIETRTAGTRLAPPAAPPSPPRGRFGTGRQRAAAAAFAALVALAALVVVLATRDTGSGSGSGSPPASASQPPKQTATPSPSARVVKSIHIGGRVNGIAAAGGRIWAGAFKSTRLVGIDPEKVRRAPPESAEIGIGLVGIAVSGNTMWAIAARDRRLVHLDTRTGRRIGEPVSLPGIATAVAADRRTVWVAVSDPTIHTGDRILEFDAGTGSLKRTLNVLNGVCRLIVSDGALWMLGSTPARLARIDLRTGKRHRIRFEANQSGDLVAGAGSVWLTLIDVDQLVRVNPRTWNVATIAVGHEPIGVTPDGGSIWVANRASSTVSRVSARSLRVRDEIPVPINPYELAADRNGLWVTSLATGRVSRVTPARAG